MTQRMLNRCFGRDVAGLVFGYLPWHIGMDWCIICNDAIYTPGICRGCYARYDASKWFGFMATGRSREDIVQIWGVFQSARGVDIELLVSRIKAIMTSRHKLRTKMLMEWLES